MRFIRFSNGVIINVDEITSVSKPRKADPYSKTYGELYDITLSSGEVHTFYDSINAEPNHSPPTYGKAVYPYRYMFELLKPWPDMLEEKS
jgi:hypothetical protein